MPRTATGFTISTLQDHLDCGYEITVYCPNHHSSKADLPALIKALGSDFEIIGHRDYFLSRLRCRQCGEKASTIRVSPSGLPEGGYGPARP